MSEHDEKMDPRPEPDATRVEGESLARRAALACAVGAAGVVFVGGAAYPVYKYLNTAAEEAEAEAKQTEVVVPDGAKLPAGASLAFKFGGRPTLLIHHTNGAWVAMTAVCTHLGCTVAYDAAQNIVHCACHGGNYDATTGANVSGPPPTPLKTYAVEFRNGEVVVKRA